MQKPILLAIDDDSNRLEAVVEELRRHYDQSYHIAGATTGDAALDLCHQWEANKANSVNGLPVADGLPRATEEVRVVGRRWAAADHAVRDFLTRNRVEYQWLNPDKSIEAKELLRARGLADAGLPVVLFGDGTALVQPTSQELAAKVGLRIEAQREVYDLIVVGAGPAGLGAAVYAASEGLTTLVVEPDAVGGQAGSSSCIENYLGFPHGVSGDELARRSYVQASRLGAEFLTQRVTGIRSEGGMHHVRTGDGRELRCRVCLIATGVEYCRLELAEADRFVGAGVYYGATRAEARACMGEVIYLVGGANSAGQSALHFARYASRVHVLVRGESLAASMSQYLIDQIVATPNIIVESETEVIALAGNEHLEGLTLNTPRGAETREATSLFLFIGAVAKTEWLPEEIAVDEDGFVLAGPDLLARAGGRVRVAADDLAQESECAKATSWPQVRAGAAWSLDREPFLLETSVPGIFVAGDVRARSVKRCAAAAGEGSIAVSFMHQYLATL
jgi:thioredoxin reductase (NADPH)